MDIDCCGQQTQVGIAPTDELNEAEEQLSLMSQTDITAMTTR